MSADLASPAGDQQRLKGNLDLLLLSVLAARGPAHGYAVIGGLRDRSEGTFDLPEGTVYPALHRLERAGLLSARWQCGEDATGDRATARPRRLPLDRAVLATVEGK